MLKNSGNPGLAFKKNLKLLVGKTMVPNKKPLKTLQAGKAYAMPSMGKNYDKNNWEHLRDLLHTVKAVRGVSGTWKDLTDDVNCKASNLTNQVRNIAKVTTAVANGDLSQKKLQLMPVDKF